jgi:hypothetical protein
MIVGITTRYLEEPGVDVFYVDTNKLPEDKKYLLETFSDDTDHFDELEDAKVELPQTVTKHITVWH